MARTQITGLQVLDGTITADDLAEDIPIHITVENNTGSTLVAGTLVKSSGVSAGVITVTPLVGGDTSFLGVVDDDILDTETGILTTSGSVTYNTASFTAGDTLYLNSAGTVVNTRPLTSHIYLGIALDSAGAGTLFVPRDAGLVELASAASTSIKRTTITESVDVSSFTGIRQNASGITTTLTGAIDGKRIQIYNASDSDNIIGATINGEVSPTICPDESFDLEYHATEGEWVL